MFESKSCFGSQSCSVVSRVGVVLLLGFVAFVAFPSSALANTLDVTKSPYNAVGNGMADDTNAITAAIGDLNSGDTLYFPCTGGGSTYLITSQLTILKNKNGVLLSNVTVEGDSSGCATIKDQYAGPYQQAIMLVGGDTNGNPNLRLGTTVLLGATANELTTSFTTSTNLGVAPGDYVYLCQSGVGGNGGGTNQLCGSMSVICDPSGCRAEILKVASVSGNSVNVTTALHDTYDPANSATATKMTDPLVGVTVQNLTFTGIGYPHVVKGLALAGVFDSTVSNVKSTNVQGSAIQGNGNFNVAWSNTTVTGAGSDLCGSAVWFQNQGNLSVKAMSVSQENTIDGGIGCAANDAFGFELISAANSTITNLSVDATGASGRPFKTTAARWNTFNSPTVTDQTQPTLQTSDPNGISLEYYSSHNIYNSCRVSGVGTTGTRTSNAGVNLFGNYNQYNTFNNCTVSGNGNTQFFDQNGSDAGHQTDSHNTINGGSFTGTNTVESVVLIQAGSSSTYGATLTGPGPYGVELDAQATNACVNNSTFEAGSGLGGAISANGSNDVGSGNQLNNLGVSGNFTAGTCGNNFGYAVQGANAGTTMSNTITASRYQMAGQSGTITSMSVFVASPVSASPNNQFQVAIYADNNGTPGALIASGASQTIVPDAWNTVLMNAPATANSYYWLAYNTNGLAGNANNVPYDSQGVMNWITPESFGTWPSSFGTPSGTSTGSLSLFATVEFNALGHEARGANVGATMSNSVTATRYQMPAQTSTITSVSVFVASPVSASPNNQFQVAIYADNNGTPGALIASSASQTIVPDAWSVVPINASVTANSYYWLAYNTNGLDGNANNLRFDPGGPTSEWITSEPFGTWPATYGPVGGTSNYNASIYASFQ